MSTSTDLASRLKEAVDAKARLEARLEERDEAHLEKVVLLEAQLDERETDLSNAKAKYGQDLKEAQRLAEEIKARSEQDHAC